MAAKHTPGPWFVRRQEDPERPNGWMLPHYWHVESVEGRWVADFPRLVAEAQEQQEADIFLIAAAPEMYALLQDAHDFIDEQSDADIDGPNWAMSLAGLIRELLDKVDKQ